MPVLQHRVREEIVGACRVVRRRLRVHAGAARAGHAEERRDADDAGALEREERQLRRRGEAAGRRERRGAAQPGAEHVGEGVGESGDELRRGVRPVVPLVQAKVAHAEVGREIHDEAGAGVEDLARHLRGFPVLEGEEDHVLAARRLACGESREARLGQLGEGRMHVGDGAAGLAPAGRHDFGDVRVLEHQPEQLATHVPGGPDDGDLHLVSRAAVTAVSSPAASRNALCAGMPRAALM